MSRGRISESPVCDVSGLDVRYPPFTVAAVLYAVDTLPGVQR